MAGGAIFNYVLDKSPSDDRPSHAAWYTIVLNLDMLLGSLGGPWLAEVFSLLAVLVICAIVRFLAGLVILRWGSYVTIVAWKLRLLQPIGRQILNISF